MASLLLRRAILGSTINSTRAFARRRPPPLQTPHPSSIAFLSIFAALGSSASTESSSSLSPYQLNQMSAKQFVESAVADNKVVVFSKSYCPYCKKAKALLINDLGVDNVTIYELDQREDGADLQNYLREKTQQGTVPNIFVNQQHVGGNDDLQAAKKDGKLAKLLATAA